MAPKRVQATFEYKQQHTDELSFKFGDIITITQPSEDGWYEGTLRGQTGWFPANYVSEYTEESGDRLSATLNKDNRLTVIQNIIETESAFVKDLDLFINGQLQPIWRTFGEYYDLINRNLELVLERHRALLSGLRAESSQSNGKFGKVFLMNYTRLQGVHVNYCSLHPKIIKFLMTSNNQSSNKLNNNHLLNNNNSLPDLTKLTIGLSSPFKRLEKYETLLEELTRLTPENHADRGDCQRSCNLYRELVLELSTIRRQKDIETEILNANIRNWDGPAISSLGEARVTCAVRGFWSDGWKDLYLIAFDSMVVLISLINPNEFQLEYKFPLNNTVISTVDKPISLELHHNSQRVVVSFQTAEDLENIRGRVDVYSTVQKRNSSKSLDNAVSLRPNGSRPTTPDTRPNTATGVKGWARISRPISPAPLPPSLSRQAISMPPLPTAKLALPNDKTRYIMPHLRPKKPIQKEPIPALKRGSSTRKHKKEVILPPIADEPPTDPKQYERDLQILKVVEAFANLSKKPRIPVGGVATTTLGLHSLPSVRVSSITMHSVSPIECREERMSSVSPVSPPDQATLIRTLQYSVALLTEQMAKMQTELSEERRELNALKEQLSLLTRRSSNQ